MASLAVRDLLREQEALLNASLRQERAAERLQRASPTCSAPPGATPVHRAAAATLPRRRSSTVGAGVGRAPEQYCRDPSCMKIGCCRRMCYMLAACSIPSLSCPGMEATAPPSMAEKTDGGKLMSVRVSMVYPDSPSYAAAPADMHIALVFGQLTLCFNQTSLAAVVQVLPHRLLPCPPSSTATPPPHKRSMDPYSAAFLHSTPVPPVSPLPLQLPLFVLTPVLL